MLRVEGQVEQVQREWEVVQIRDVFGLARCPRDEVVPVEVVRKAPLGSMCRSGEQPAPPALEHSRLKLATCAPPSTPKSGVGFIDIQATGMPRSTPCRASQFKVCLTVLP
eukprot:scaffold108998_cov64-Phaeocystis_antarctica.AAC.3